MTGPAALLKTDALLLDLERLLGRGRHQAIPGAELALALGVSARTIRELVGELIDSDVLVGSTCSGESAGYFLCVSRADVEVGTRHLVSRARTLNQRVGRLRRAAERQFGPEVLTLFDLEKVSA